VQQQYLTLIPFAGRRAHLWATFNEPEAASLCGHVLGNNPPGHLFQFKAAGQKLLNMLRCHAAAYRAIKQMPGMLHASRLIITGCHACRTTCTGQQAQIC